MTNARRAPRGTPWGRSYPDRLFGGCAPRDMGDALGWYWLLLWRQFQDSDGTIPDDVDECAALAGVVTDAGRALFRSKWSRIRERFDVLPGGRLQHPVMERERQDALARVEQTKAATETRLRGRNRKARTLRDTPRRTARATSPATDHAQGTSRRTLRADSDPESHVTCNDTSDVSRRNDNDNGTKSRPVIGVVGSPTRASAPPRVREVVALARSGERAAALAGLGAGRRAVESAVDRVGGWDALAFPDGDPRRTWAALGRALADALGCPVDPDVPALEAALEAEDVARRASGASAAECARRARELIESSGPAERGEDRGSEPSRAGGAPRRREARERNPSAPGAVPGHPARAEHGANGAPALAGPLDLRVMTTDHGDGGAA